MKRMPFKRPTPHYDEKIKIIDDQICELINERKKLSDNPGYPPFEYIAHWADKFHLYEDMLKSIFASLWNEKAYKPSIEPEEFKKTLSVLKSTEVANRLFSVVYIRQYSNCSVVNLNIDCNIPKDEEEKHPHYKHYELFINEQYDCSTIGGRGGDDHFNYNFIVSPALPDNMAGIKLTFREYSRPSADTKIGDDIIMQL